MKKYTFVLGIFLILVGLEFYFASITRPASDSWISPRSIGAGFLMVGMMVLYECLVRDVREAVAGKRKDTPTDGETKPT